MLLQRLDLHAVVDDHHSGHLLAEVVVRAGEHHDLADGGVLGKDGLDLGRVDVLVAVS